MFLLPTDFKIPSHLLLSRLTSYFTEIVGENQCGFWGNRSTTNEIFAFAQILGKHREFNKVEHQLFFDFSKAYDSVQRNRMSEILAHQGIPAKYIRLVYTCLQGANGIV